MADKDTVKAELADQIVARIVKSDFTPDLSKLPEDDVLFGLTGYATIEAMEARERCMQILIEQAAAWLDSDPRGALMLDEAMEKEAEFEREVAEMNAEDAA